MNEESNIFEKYLEIIEEGFLPKKTSGIGAQGNIFPKSVTSSFKKGDPHLKAARSRRAMSPEEEMRRSDIAFSQELGSTEYFNLEDFEDLNENDYPFVEAFISKLTEISGDRGHKLLIDGEFKIPYSRITNGIVDLDFAKNHNMETEEEKRGGNILIRKAINILKSIVDNPQDDKQKELSDSAKTSKLNYNNIHQIIYFCKKNPWKTISEIGGKQHGVSLQQKGGSQDFGKVGEGEEAHHAKTKTHYTTPIPRTKDTTPHKSSDSPSKGIKDIIYRQPKGGSKKTNTKPKSSKPKPNPKSSSPETRVRESYEPFIKLIPF